MSRQIKYSEMFGRTIQGEGYYNGRITNWVRFFNCNLTCGGFFQANPTDPSTYIDPLKEVDVKSIKRVEDLPVIQYGCDSSYSWAKAFGHLAHSNTAEEMASKLVDLNRNEFNPDGLWIHPVTGQAIHMCFTGGEPMMQQDAIIEILTHMIVSGNYPHFVTIETNATRSLNERFISFWEYIKRESIGIELLFSMSPKLHTVSGELSSKAWKPDTMLSYKKLADISTIKLVVNNTPECMAELVEKLPTIKQSGMLVYAMPVGATLEEQEEHSTEFYDALIDMGMNIADRTHVRIYGNVVGK